MPVMKCLGIGAFEAGERGSGGMALEVTEGGEPIPPRHAVSARRIVGKCFGNQHWSTRRTCYFDLLSMSAGVIARAPWLIFDKPVVHVDDLNLLSFLDVLRDLVLLGTPSGVFRHGEFPNCRPICQDI